MPNVHFLGLSLAAPPSTPRLFAPSGNIPDSATLTLTWDYHDTTAGNPQSAYQYQIFLAGSTAPVYDSGKVLGSATSAPYSGVTVLPKDTALEVDIRVWDTLSNGGAGTPSGYSPRSGFMIVTAGVVAITNLHVGSGSSGAEPTTAGGPQFAATVTWTQADGHSAGTYQLMLYEADLVTLFAASPPITLAPYETSGSSFTTQTLVVSGMANLTRYYLTVKVTDATTGVVSESAHWAIDTNFAPPPPPTAVLATPDPSAGHTAVTYTVDPAVSQVQVVRETIPTGVTETIYVGVPVSPIYDPSPVGQVVVYTVIAISAQGVLGDPVPADPCSLGYKAGAFGVWLISVSKPSLRVAFGALAPDAQWADVTEWDLTQDPNSYVPAGQPVPITIFGKSDYWQSGTQTWFIPNVYHGAGETVYGRDVRDMIVRMAERRGRFLYRDPDGEVRYVTISAFKKHIIARIHYQVSFTLTDVRPPLVPLTVF